MKYFNLYNAVILSFCLVIASYAKADERMQSLIGGIVGGIIQAIDDNATS